MNQTAGESARGAKRDPLSINLNAGDQVHHKNEPAVSAPFMVDAQLESVPDSPVELKENDKKDKAKRTTQFDRLTSARVDIDEPLNRLHELLGDDWPNYQTIVSDFLTGRLTRLEYETALQPLIAQSRLFIRYHNDILVCLLSNSYREGPPEDAQSLGWSKKRRILGVQISRGDPSAKRLKTEVMGLTNRERARIKAIPKPDASYRLRPNSMIETRFAKLPRVPVTPQKINSSQHHIDIVRGFHVPLATESHYLPDSASLKDRILATCLENGLLGGLDEQVPDLLVSALDVHLRNILTATLSKVRRNRIDCLAMPGASPGETVLRPEELALTHSLAPHIFVEPCHPVTRMVAIALDDSAPDVKEWTGATDPKSANQRLKVARMLDELI